MLKDTTSEHTGLSSPYLFLSVILLQLKLTKLKFEVLNRLTFITKKRKIWTQINLQITEKFRLSSTSAQVCVF